MIIIITIIVTMYKWEKPAFWDYVTGPTCSMSAFILNYKLLGRQHSWFAYDTLPYTPMSIVYNQLTSQKKKS